MKSRKRIAGIGLSTIVVVALVLAAVMTGGGTAAPKAPYVVGQAGYAGKAKCGLGNKKKATGKPIKIGTINMLIPGVDFTTMAKIVNAYFKCVNDNGGIHGRPVKYIQYVEDLNPAKQASFAHKLIQSDKVVGIVGNTSFTECGTNWKYYQQKHYTVVGAGVQAECFGKPSIVESNMGPRYSNIGAAQALLKRGAKSLIVASPSTISKYADGGVLKLAKQHHIKGKSIPVVLPLTDANSLVTQLVQEAGQGGGVIIDFTPDTAPGILQAAIAQGVDQQGEVGIVDPDRQCVHGEAVRAVRQQDLHQPGVLQPDRPATRQHAHEGDQQEVRPDRRAPGVRPDGLHGREVRDHRAAEDQGPDHG